MKVSIVDFLKKFSVHITHEASVSIYTTINVPNSSRPVDEPDESDGVEESNQELLTHNKSENGVHYEKNQAKEDTDLPDVSKYFTSILAPVTISFFNCFPVIIRSSNLGEGTSGQQTEKHKHQFVDSWYFHMFLFRIIILVLGNLNIIRI